MEEYKTVDQLCDEVLQTQGWVGYFRKSQEIMLDRTHDYDGCAQPRVVQLGIAVLERADLVLKDTWEYADSDEEDKGDEGLDEDEEDDTDLDVSPQEQAVRQAALSALKTFITHYPSDFAGHLSMTYPVFPYSGIFDLSKGDVFRFWSRVYESRCWGAGDRLPLSEERAVKWLEALASDLTYEEGGEVDEAFRYADAHAPLRPSDE
jgi:hypothetical protein